MRMFLALRVPLEAREHLSDFLEPRLDAFDVSWTPPEHWHLTLAFMDSVPERALPGLEERLELVAARRTAMTLHLEGAGSFPDPFTARVLWLAPRLDDAPPDSLDRLSAACRTAATTSGIPVDGARFVPHLTLARSRRPLRADRWLQVLSTYRGPAWRAAEVELVASHLGESRRNPRRHEVVETFSLGSAQGPGG